MSPPMTDDSTPIASASAGRPFRAIGAPSYVVMMAAGVPGMLSNIAEHNPPETPPTYMAINKNSPSVGAIRKVKGNSSVIANAPVNPGIVPKTNPMNIPNNIYKITTGCAIRCSNPI
jgi:hypothetical protein